MTEVSELAKDFQFAGGGDIWTVCETCAGEGKDTRPRQYVMLRWRHGDVLQAIPKFLCTEHYKQFIQESAKYDREG